MPHKSIGITTEEIEREAGDRRQLAKGRQPTCSRIRALIAAVSYSRQGDFWNIYASCTRDVQNVNVVCGLRIDADNGR